MMNSGTSAFLGGGTTLLEHHTYQKHYVTLALSKLYYHICLPQTMFEQPVLPILPVIKMNLDQLLHNLLESLQWHSHIGEFNF